MPTPSIPVPRFSPRTLGIGAAVVTRLLWRSFILSDRASSGPARGGLLTPLDLAFCRIVSAAPGVDE